MSAQRSSALMAMAMLAATGPSTGTSEHVITLRPSSSGIVLPRSAQGSGSRGRPNCKPAYDDRAALKRRRKLALASKRKNRRKS